MPDTIAKILVLDDEAELRSLLQRYLSEQGYTVRAVADSAQMDKLLQRERFDVRVLDVMLPGEGGLTVCRRLRGLGETIPIIMLTARGDPVDRIVDLEVGADDYLSKPFNPRELVARIQALLRRQTMLGAQSGAVVDEVVRFGPYTLNLATCRLDKDGKDIPLTSSEFGLLKVLATHPGRPLGRERLMELARGRDHEATDRSVDVQVLRLRRLIEEDPASPRYIQTVWGMGYKFVVGET